MTQEIIEKLMKLEEKLDELLKEKKTEYLNVDEAAEYLRVSRYTVYTYASKGIIPSVRMSGKLLFRKADLSKQLEKTKKPAYL